MLFGYSVYTKSTISFSGVFGNEQSGLDLQATDIIKSDLIGKLSSEEDRYDYNQRWESMEVELGRGRFNDLFTYIRMLYAKEKAKRSLLEEFRLHVLKFLLTQCSCYQRY